MITSCEWLPLVRLHVPPAHASEACESFSASLHSLQDEQHRNRCKLQIDSIGFKRIKVMGVAIRIWPDLQVRPDRGIPKFHGTLAIGCRLRIRACLSQKGYFQ